MLRIIPWIIDAILYKPVVAVYHNKCVICYFVYYVNAIATRNWRIEFHVFIAEFKYYATSAVLTSRRQRNRFFFATSTINIQFDFFIVYPLKKSCIFFSIDYVRSPDLTVIARALSVLVYS